MRRKFNVRQRNYIILGLCSILLVMAAGYAAFRSQLTINGTSNITSDWKVLITDIQSNVLSGDATDAEAPSHTETTATFKTNLVSPGDSMQYDITVENQGDIDAVLESIDVKTSENEAILFETSGIKRGDKLLPEESDVLTVVVTYNPEVTNQPDNLNSEVTVTLNYVQDDGSILPEPEGESIGGINVPTVESGDGLYEDEYEEGRYVYRGANPNNYIEFNNELWRIISKEADGTYKILRNETVTSMPFDSARARTTGYCSQGRAPILGCNAWSSTANMIGSPSEFTNGIYTGTVDADSEMLTYLNGEYYNDLNGEAQELIVNNTWNVGGIFGKDNRYGEIELALEEEKAYQWNGNVGLINVTDYLNANSNQSLCSSGMVFNSNTCVATDWMYIPGTYWWSLSPYYYDSDSVFGVRGDGDLYYDIAGISYGVRPAVYLTSSLSLSGSGTQSDPYRIG